VGIDTERYALRYCCSLVFRRIHDFHVCFPNGYYAGRWICIGDLTFGSPGTGEVSITSSNTGICHLPNFDSKYGCFLVELGTWPGHRSIAGTRNCQASSRRFWVAGGHCLQWIRNLNRRLIRIHRSLSSNPWINSQYRRQVNRIEKSAFLVSNRQVITRAFLAHVSSYPREFPLSFQLCPMCQPRPLGHL
jgi:hypothetical protein